MGVAGYGGFVLLLLPLGCEVVVVVSGGPTGFLVTILMDWTSLEC
jgi:hypothetical protein